LPKSNRRERWLRLFSIDYLYGNITRHKNILKAFEKE
jgi:hypothetical protein